MQEFDTAHTVRRTTEVPILSPIRYKYISMIIVLNNAYIGVLLYLVHVKI
jgi:hypothetical protein